MERTKKDLRQYLHLYLGVECWVQGQIEEKPIKLTGISYDDQTGDTWCYFENTETGYALIQDVMPLLRNLSSMTEDEFFEAGKIHVAEGGKILITLEEVKQDVKAPIRPGVFVYLLSKSFDLFGLVDAGLAIDSTKQNS